MAESEVDFSYRHLSDADEPRSLASRLQDEPGDESHVTVVTHTSELSTPHSSLLLPEQSASSYTLDAAHGQHVSEDKEPHDWASEEGTRHGAGRLMRRPTFGSMRRDSQRIRQRVEVPALLTSTAPSNLSPVRRGSISTAQVVLTPLSTTPSPIRKLPATATASKTTLHGKDIGHFVSIGSIDQIARNSNSVDWSESMAVPDQPDLLSLMDPYYDLTNTKLARIFGQFGPDEGGTVSYEGFRKGLEAMGIVCGDDDEFQSFIHKVDEDHSGRISFTEFQQAIQEIKLAQLFREDFVRDMAADFAPSMRVDARLGSIEYSPDRIRSVYPIVNDEKFIYSRKPSWAAVRWINVEGCDPLLIRRLSVRYRLHPLAVEDALDVDRERPKYEKYDEHSSLILHTVRPVDMAKLRQYQRMYRNSLYDRNEGPSQFELMDKRELEDRLFDLRIGMVMTNPEQLSIYMLKDVLISVQEQTSALWGVIKSRLDTSYSKIRQNGAPFLAYTIVDACVDDLTPIIHTLGAKLMMLERLLTLDPNRFDVSRLHHCAKQIKGLKRLCKPLNEVVLQMSESNDFSGDILRYFRDVQDHIAIVQDDCDKHLDACKSLVDEVHNIRAGQQNDVSYLLTLVAAIFLPAQFLTGLYGMNFEVMPELKYQYGYLVWWIVTLGLASLTVVYFHMKRWL